MDLQAASAFVRVIAENYSFYSVATQRALLEGIFQLADECQENLSARVDAQEYEDVQTSLGLTKRFANEAIKNGDLCEGFRLACDSFWPSANLPQTFD